MGQSESAVSRRENMEDEKDQAIDHGFKLESQHVKLKAKVYCSKRQVDMLRISTGSAGSGITAEGVHCDTLNDGSTSQQRESGS